MAARWSRFLPPLLSGMVSLSLTMAMACSGSIGGSGPAGGGPSNTGGGKGNGGGSTSVPSNDTKGPILSTPAASTRMARLNNQQWENTVQDLLRLPAPLGLSKSFVAEPLITAFDTNGGVLTVDSNNRLDFQTAAEAIAKQVAHDTQSLAMVAPTVTSGDRATSFIQNFGQRVFRRPLTAADTTRYKALFDRGATLLASGDAFVDGVELVLRALLQSPHFLYRVESSTAVVSGRIPLTDYEIASRLSYSLASTMPDNALFTAAAAHKLQTRDGVVEQAQRLISSPAGRATISDFNYQLLHLRDFDQINKDVQAAPAFTPDIGGDLKQEVLSFTDDIVFGQDRGMTELLTAPYTFANSKVAKVYGLASPSPAAGQPDPFVKVNLDPTQRAGFLTQAGFLSSNADGQTPSIIVRGVEIAKDILCVEIPPPPDVVPPLPALDPNSTNRQRVTTLTMNAPCNACHTTLINPLGFGLEHLDGFAQFRTQENGQPIDSSGSYSIDGHDVSFNGALDLIKAIANSQQAQDCYASHLVQYLYGRDVDMSSDADQKLVTQAGVRAKADSSTKNLVVNLVATDAFLTRAP
ncbi:MAG TPA: DUF1592 domain-containing protein [Polyangia bacterium]